MKLAYICMDAGVPVFGTKGCSLHAQEMLRAFLNLGFEIDLFAANVKGAPPNDLTQITIHAIPEITCADPQERENLLMNNNSKLRALLVKAKQFDLIYERYSLWSYAAMEFANSKSIPGIVEVNAPLIDEQRKYRQLIQQEHAFFTSSRCLNAASQVVAVSDGITPYLDRFSLDKYKINVIPNGVNPNRFLNNKKNIKNNRFSKKFTIGFVGSLRPWHGVDILANAFSEFNRLVSQSRLLIIGDGPERQNLENLAEQLHVSHCINFTGAVDPEQIPILLDEIDIAVAPYPDLAEFYFSPIKVYEYMAASLPVIASDIGQLKDLIVSGHDGLLCEPGNVDALLKSLLVLYGSPILRQKLGAQARNKILANHTWDGVAKKIAQLAA